MAFVIPQPPIPAADVTGTGDQFPVHRIYCVGRNYAEHAREMGHDPDREPPFFFQKSPDNLVRLTPGGEGEFPYPTASGNVHHEIELVAALSGGDLAGTGKPGKLRAIRRALRKLGTLRLRDLGLNRDAC